MTVIASRDLRNQTRALLNRVEDGETLTISVSGRCRDDRVIGSIDDTPEVRRAAKPATADAHYSSPDMKADAALAQMLDDDQPERDEDERRGRRKRVEALGKAIGPRAADSLLRYMTDRHEDGLYTALDFEEEIVWACDLADGAAG